MKRAALIGDPVEHSLSPIMHNAAFRAMGLDAVYELWPTPIEKLVARFREIRIRELLGVNVTVPHKQAVIPLCDELTVTARRIGAVNTLIFRDQVIVGDNTDGFGFRRTVELATARASPKNTLILGAGGAARAVAVALVDAGAGSVTIANQTRSRAESLVSTLVDAGVMGIVAIDWEHLPENIAEADVVINATSIGWHGEEMPVSDAVIAAMDSAAVVIDLTYRDTALLRAVRARHLRGVDGLSMLIHQGARSLELWTGIAPPIDVMTDAVVNEQARRERK